MLEIGFTLTALKEFCDVLMSSTCVREIEWWSSCIIAANGDRTESKPYNSQRLPYENYLRFPL